MAQCGRRESPAGAAIPMRPTVDRRVVGQASDRGPSAEAALSGSAKSAPRVSAPPRRAYRVGKTLRHALRCFLDCSCIGDARRPTASRKRLFAIVLTRHEAEFHSQTGRIRRRGAVLERCPAPQFSQSGRGISGNSLDDQPAVRALEARVRAALSIRTTRRCRPNRSRRMIPHACKA